MVKGLGAHAPMSSMGSVILSPTINNYKIDIKFHVIESSVNVPLDGIIGTDFFDQEKIEINFSERTIKLKSIPMPIPFGDPEIAKREIQVVPPRTETVIRVNIINSTKLTEGITPNVIIDEGVYLAKAILKVDQNNQALTTVVNTTNQVCYINVIDLKLENFNYKESSVFTYHIENTIPKDRINVLFQNLRLDHLNIEEKKAITTLCKTYNDIFHLPGDALTYTDAIEHSITTTTPTPTRSKIYRLPKVHEEEVNTQVNKMLKENLIRPSTSPYNAPLWVVPKKRDASGIQKWRVVVDYRKLNEITVGTQFPIPNIDQILDQLGHSCYFSTLDLASGFHQIKMKDSDAHKTAFSTNLGHFEFTRMSFGLRTAPATFQRLMNTILTGLQGKQCFVYLDDIIVYASSLDEHQQKLKLVFDRLRNNNLKLQPDKCEFLRKEIMYLGHVISDSNVQPNPDKIKAVAEFPLPKNQKQIKQFLGLAGYYRKFIQNFAAIAKPLTVLLKKDEKFNWGEPQQKSFNKFKRILTNKPILQLPDFSKEFILTTDASDYAIGSILSQGEIGKDLPISYASRTLNQSEINYSTTEKECLSIIWSVKHFRHYLFGQKFKIVTDHQPLTYLFNCKDPSSRLVRWRLKLEEYNYEIIYKPGRVNSNVDALSRNPVMFIHRQPCNLMSVEEDTYEDFIKFHYRNQILYEYPILKENIFDKNPNVLLFSKDLSTENNYYNNVSELYDLNKINPNDVKLYDTIILNNNEKTTYLLIAFLNYFDLPSSKDLYYSLHNFSSKLTLDTEEIFIKNPQFYNPNLKLDIIFEMLKFIFGNKVKIKLVDSNKFTPSTKEEINKLIKEYHSTSLSGHSGFYKTYKRIKENYKWQTMKKDIKAFVKNCQQCQINKTNRHPVKTPMQITTTSKEPFEKIFLDIVGPLPLTINGNKFILTIQDDLTKFSYAYAIFNHEAETVANKICSFIFLFGIPQSIVTDNGTDFTSNLIKEINKIFKIKHVTTSPYHPQSNGALERSHSTLKDYLKHFINKDQNNWDDFIETAMFAYNTQIHSTTQFSPYELLFGRKPSLPHKITQTPEFHYSYDDYHRNLQLRLNKSFETARNHIIQSKEKSKVYYDNKTKPHNFKIDDMVYILDKSTQKGVNKKLSPNYKGPYKIIQIHDNDTITVEINKKKTATYHANLLKPC